MQWFEVQSSTFKSHSQWSRGLVVVVL